MQNLLDYWLQRCYTALFFLLPWSVEVPCGVFAINMPAEPLMAVCSLLLLGQLICPNPTRPPALKNFRDVLRGKQGGNGGTIAFGWRNPLVLSLLWLIWMGISAFFSSMPLVSWKYWIVEATHWWLFAFGMALVPGLWRRVIPWFGGSMVLFVVYALAHHGQYHFRADQSILAPMPFFPDHTLYAAVLAMLLPWSGLVAHPNGTKQANFHLGHKALFVLPSWIKGSGRIGFVATILLIGLWFAFCRAAWLSLMVAGCAVFLLYRFRAFGNWVVLLLFTGLLASLFVWPLLTPRLAANLAIRDVSLLERLNRYACAGQMARERPVTGFGPGTFQFQYLPFQRSENATRITISEPVLERNADTYGRGGGAHSEYLQSLSETGWPGVALQFVFIAAVLFGFNGLYKKTGAWPILFCLFSLLTFFLHGMVNNFLHDGRIAALVLGAIGHYNGLFGARLSKF